MVKLFQRAQRSLFGEILDWMLTPLLLLVPVSIGITWLVAQGIANAPYDRALEHSLMTLARMAAAQPVDATFTLPSDLQDLLRSENAASIYFQVLDDNGQLLAGAADLPWPGADAPIALGHPILRDGHVRGEPVRLGFVWIEPASHGARGAPRRLLVQMAETREKQSLLASEIIRGVLLPQFAILPLAVLLIWLALVRGIRPLSAVEERIRERKSEDLSPLDESQVPQEVVPLVSSINELLRKLADSMATQKRFLADAAHQLKTPLAGLRMQAELAQREGEDTQALKRSLQQIGRASTRATHTVNQLLAMARAESGAATLARQPCDLAQLAIEVVREAVPHAIAKGIDLGYEGVEPGASGLLLPANPTLLKELVRNLVDNAIAYTPATAARPGVVTARVLADRFGRVVVLQVEDNGPGIGAADRELVFQPFYRVLGNEADGSGLGLPIVREIARQHGASVTLDDAHPGNEPPGTRFSVRFVLAD